MRPFRILIASVVGGVVMFAWGAVDHMALPFGMMGIKNLPAEEALLPHMKQAIPEHGLYFFPGKDETDKSDAACKAWEAKIRSGPRGLLIFNPAGGEPISPKQLGTEFASNVLAALLLAVVLARLRTGALAGGLFGLVLGVYGWMSIEASYWNWHDYPCAFATASLIEQAVGGLLSGLAIALVIGRPPAQSAV